MSEQMSDNDKPRDLDQEQARLAYTIIESLLEHTRVVSDLIALMAQTLDQDTTKRLRKRRSGPRTSTAAVRQAHSRRGGKVRRDYEKPKQGSRRQLAARFHVSRQISQRLQLRFGPPQTLSHQT